MERNEPQAFASEARTGNKDHLVNAISNWGSQTNMNSVWDKGRLCGETEYRLGVSLRSKPVARYAQLRRFGEGSGEALGVRGESHTGCLWYGSLLRSILVSATRSRPPPHIPVIGVLNEYIFLTDDPIRRIMMQYFGMT